MDKKEVESVVREVLRRTADIKAGQAVPGENHLTAANGGLIRTQMPLALALKLMEKICGWSPPCPMLPPDRWRSTAWTAPT